jgi:hypothetical protein
MHMFMRFRKYGEMRRSGCRRQARALLTMVLTMITVVAMAPGAAQASTLAPIETTQAFLCVGVRGSHYSDLAEVGDCRGTPTQTWSFRSSTTIAGAPAVQLRNQDVVNNVPACLGVAGGSASDGAQAWVGACTGTAATDHSQAWRFGAYINNRFTYVPIPGPGTIYTNVLLVNGHSGLCLDTYGSHLVSGEYLVQTKCDQASLSQLWTVVG